jgi:D-serine deaminase-like pyridoxal phosphate-dependent protein
VDSLLTIDTPALVLERPVMEANIAAMQERLTAHGVPLRPHVKTAKSIEVIRLMLEGQPGGVTVSTLAEAEYCAANGITDILYAVGIVASKVDRIARLGAGGARVTVITDSRVAAADAGRRARELGITLAVMIEIDSDGHRAGLAPDDPEVVVLGRFLRDEDGVEPAGVMTHAGGSYGSSTTGAIAGASYRERGAVVAAADRLRAAGVPCPAVSVGSTPTATYAETLTGVTEVRAGVYVFQDLVMAGLGVCSVGDIAMSVLCSVIGHRQDRGWLITDAGWTSLSRDRGTASQAVDQGYGIVCHIDGRPVPELIVVDTNQEHGIIADRRGRPLEADRFPVGSRLRILPNHACATGAMHDRYQVVAGSPDITAVWSRVSGW